MYMKTVIAGNAISDKFGYSSERTALVIVALMRANITSSSSSFQKSVMKIEREGIMCVL